MLNYLFNVKPNFSKYSFFYCEIHYFWKCWIMILSSLLLLSLSLTSLFYFPIFLMLDEIYSFNLVNLFLLLFAELIYVFLQISFKTCFTLLSELLPSESFLKCLRFMKDRKLTILSFEI